VTKLDLSRARTHDLGGQPAGPIDTGAHGPDPWHRLVTALLGALREHHVTRVDEMRRAIEDMPADDYRRLGYFEKWAVAVSTLVVEKGLMSRAEIDRRIAAIKDRAK
jgi:Nitrile hydratase beta subunit